jgi:hypothetical protein
VLLQLPSAKSSKSKVLQRRKLPRTVKIGLGLDIWGILEEEQGSGREEPQRAELGPCRAGSAGGQRNIINGADVGGAIGGARSRALAPPIAPPTSAPFIIFLCPPAEPARHGPSSLEELEHEISPTMTSVPFV